MGIIDIHNEMVVNEILTFRIITQDDVVKFQCDYPILLEIDEQKAQRFINRVIFRESLKYLIQRVNNYKPLLKNETWSLY